MVTDDEIQEIIDRDEAGVGDLLKAYGAAEQAYMAAATAQGPVGELYSTVTRPVEGGSTIINSTR
jgi:hypothetical protein